MFPSMYNNQEVEEQQNNSDGFLRAQLKKVLLIILLFIYYQEVGDKLQKVSDAVIMSISTGTIRADDIQTAGFASVWIRKDNIKIDDTNAFIHGSHTGPYVGSITFQLMVTI